MHLVGPRAATATLLVAGTLTLPLPAVAGPPLICHPFDIGTRASLPWGDGSRGWNDPSASYNLNRLTSDTLELLTPSTPVIVRMETLRRAAIYATKDERVARELLTRLGDRARAAEAKGTADALAWFDAGYLAETYKQAAPFAGATARIGADIDGYSLVTRSLKMRGSDPAIEFAAALITAGSRKEAYAEHARRARAGASRDTLLARNLPRHLAS